MKLPWNRENSELDREVAFHIETMADSIEAQGMTRKEALERARREFGGVEQCKEECRDESRWRFAVQLAQDLRFGWRMMRKSPAASLAAVLSLALGIGATTTIYSFAHAVLWRKLAIPAPEQMVELFWEVKAQPDNLMRSSSGSRFRDEGLFVADYFSKPGFESMRSRVHGVVDLAAHIYAEEVSVSYAGSVTTSHTRGVSDNFFRVLGIQPAYGRFPAYGAPEVAVTHRFWERVLGSSDKAIGTTVRINNYPYVISGVMPRSFFGLGTRDDVDLYTFIDQSPALVLKDSWVRTRRDDPFTWWFQVIGRRHDGVSLEKARSAVDAAFGASWPAKPKSAAETPRMRLLDASTGLGGVRREFGNPVWILLALVATVLIVTCANIANLLLARAVEREKEAALRVSLGCGSGRLMRQYFTESLLMAALGGVLSIAVAFAFGGLMAGVLPATLNPASLLVELSSHALAATCGITFATALLFGLYPAWRASRVDVAPALKEGCGTAGSAMRNRFLPARLLVLTQVTLGVLLVTAAIIYTGNLSHIVTRDAGFERERLLLFDLRPGELAYEGDRLDSFFQRVEDRLKAIPGVAEVGLSRNRPMRGGGYYDGVAATGGTKHVNSAIHHVSAGFTSALGVPLVAGRQFTQQDVRGGKPVAIISEQLANSLNVPSPVGTRIAMEDRKTYEVVGIARNAAYARLTQPSPVTYIPFPKGTRNATVVVRTNVNPLSVLTAATAAIHEIDSGVPLVNVFTMEQQISRTLQRERMFAWLCGSFGVLALVLCVVGLYGLMSHSTARRTPEIGIRMALGAPASRVMREVVSDGMRLAGAGVLLGSPLAIYGAKLAQQQRMLPEGPIPYWTLGAAVGILALAALAAVFGPALRASSVDPIRALRQG